MKENIILCIVTKLLIPLIILFALYVQFHGDYSPGGGFQAGVIFSSALILYRLIFGLEAGNEVIPRPVLKLFASLGVLLYAGTGVAALFMDNTFLNYSVLADTPIHGQHMGIILVELGVGFTVSSTMLLIFDSFAGRPLTTKDANTGEQDD